MNNVLKLLSFTLMLSLFFFSCNNDDEMEENNCTTDPAVTIAENIIGTWIMDGASSETVTFNADGTGSSSMDAFHFSTTNNDINYNNFDWTVDANMTITIAYDYSPDTPVVPFIISEDYDVLLNNCDRINMESTFFGNMVELTR